MREQTVTVNTSLFYLLNPQHLGSLVLHCVSVWRVAVQSNDIPSHSREQVDGEEWEHNSNTFNTNSGKMTSSVKCITDA